MSRHPETIPVSPREKLVYNPDSILMVRDLKKYFPIKGGMMNRVVGQVKAVDGVTFNLKRGTSSSPQGCQSTGLFACSRR